MEKERNIHVNNHEVTKNNSVNFQNRIPCIFFSVFKVGDNIQRKFCFDIYLEYQNTCLFLNQALYQIKNKTR